MNVDTFDDSAYALRYTGDFKGIKSQGWVEKQNTARKHNDAPVICTDTYQGVSFRNESQSKSNRWEPGFWKLI